MFFFNTTLNTYLLKYLLKRLFNCIIGVFLLFKHIIDISSTIVEVSNNKRLRVLYK